MKLNKIYLVLFFVTNAVLLQAQTVEKIFVNNLPDDILPTLTKDNRLELIEYHRLGQKDTVENVFHNEVFVLNYDSINQQISIQSSENSRFDIKLFPTSEKPDTTSYVIGIINTVCAPVCSSYIRFYDYKWNEIKTNIPVWNATDWLTDKEKIIDGVKIADIFKTTFLELSFDKKTNQLLVKNNSADLLSVEDKMFAKSYLSNESKKYKINISTNEINIVP